MFYVSEGLLVLESRIVLCKDATAVVEKTKTFEAVSIYFGHLFVLVIEVRVFACSSTQKSSHSPEECSLLCIQRLVSLNKQY